jgi:hypothetical protein
MVERFQAAPGHLYVEQATSGPKVLLHRLEAKADELWSFVGKKANRQWLWIAMDAMTRQVLAFHVGDRSRQSATALWEKLPVMYQQQALFSTEQYAVEYRCPASSSTPRHRQAGPHDHPSRRTVQRYAAATGCAAGPCYALILQETQHSHL